jgi:hypothetical protein
MLRPFVSSLRKIFINILINLLLGIGVMMQSFNDSIFKIVFLFSFQEIKESLIFTYNISVSFPCWFAHINGIISIITFHTVIINKPNTLKRGIVVFPIETSKSMMKFFLID